MGFKFLTSFYCTDVKTTVSIVFTSHIFVRNETLLIYLRYHLTTPNPLISICLYVITFLILTFTEYSLLYLNMYISINDTSYCGIF